MKRSPSLSKLITLARDARRRVEVYARRERGCKTLGGYCAVASFYLKHIANKEGLFPTYVSGNFREYNRIMSYFRYISGHVWLELENTIIDITATQFVNTVSDIERNFNKKVYICSNTNPHYQKLIINDEAVVFSRTWNSIPLEQSCEIINQYD